MRLSYATWRCRECYLVPTGGSCTLKLQDHVPGPSTAKPTSCPFGDGISCNQPLKPAWEFVKRHEKL